MRSFILGTDWGADSDDAIAVRLLARAAKSERIRLLGIGINCVGPHSYASMKAYLKNEDLDVPVGLDTHALNFDWRETYQLRLASLMPEVANAEADSALRVYRRAIAESEGPVEIAEVGFLQVLADLIESPADDISPLSGLELMREKVAHVWIMGGKWNEDGGKEFNLSAHPTAARAAALVCEKCPAPITFLGFEIGANVITGNLLPETDLLKQALIDHGSGGGRESWDPMLVTLALTGTPEAAGYDAVYGRATVDGATGANHFEEAENGPHRYVKKAAEDDFYIDRINGAIA